MRLSTEFFLIFTFTINSVKLHHQHCQYIKLKFMLPSFSYRFKDSFLPFYKKLEKLSQVRGIFGFLAFCSVFSFCLCVIATARIFVCIDAKIGTKWYIHNNDKRWSLIFLTFWLFGDCHIMSVLEYRDQLFNHLQLVTYL